MTHEMHEYEDDGLDQFFASERERVGADAYIGEVTTSSANVAELLSFWAGDEEYAVEIVHIKEIILPPVVTRVPGVKPGVLGIISLRGVIVPIVSLRSVLHMPEAPASRHNRILVLEVDQHPLGLVVDRVTSVARLERDAIEPKPRGIRREAVEYLLGVGRVADRLLIVLDVPTLLASLSSLV